MPAGPADEARDAAPPGAASGDGTPTGPPGAGSGRRRGPARLAAAIWLVAIVAPLVVLLAGWDRLTTTPMLGSMSIVSTIDIGVYLRESSWVVGQGTLYGTIRSEYPLAANLVFAVVRLGSLPFADALGSAKAFGLAWVTLAWVTYLATVRLSIREARLRSLAAWLTPAAVYFALVRFDLYPVAATFLALLAARDERPRRAAVWLGIAIALKGYALYALPAMVAWAWLRFGRRQAIETGLLAIGPLAASLLVVLALGGVDAMLMPFRTQAARLPNGQGTWDVIQQVTGLRASAWVRAHAWVPTALAIAGSLLAAATRPRTVEALARAFVLGIGAFVTFSVFYSPQFVLWFVPMAVLDSGTAMLAAVTAMGWVTIVYFPVAYASRSYHALFRASVVAVTILRTLVILLAVPWPRRRSSDVPSEAPA